MRHTCSILILILLACRLQAQPYRQLALKGGGVRGIAYAGALKVLEEQGVTAGIEQVAGTSAGAITGALLAVGYSATEIEELLYDMDIASFNDGGGWFIGGQRRFRKRYGWYKGARLERWLGERLKERTGSDSITLLQLHKPYKDLYVTAANLSRQRSEVFNWRTHPGMQVRTAVRASASIPLYYGAVFLDSNGHKVDRHDKNAHYDVFVDGGLLANYPVCIFNTDSDNAAGVICPYTLGLKLERPAQIAYSKDHNGLAPYDIQTFRDYMGALYNLAIEHLNKGCTYEEERKRTIYISTGNMPPRVRRMSRAQKKALFDNGEAAARAFFATGK